MKTVHFAPAGDSPSSPKTLGTSHGNGNGQTESGQEIGKESAGSVQRSVQANPFEALNLLSRAHRDSKLIARELGGALSEENRLTSFMIGRNAALRLVETYNRLIEIEECA